MNHNGQEQAAALAIYDPLDSLLATDPEVSQPETIRRAVLLIDWYGLEELLKLEPTLNIEPPGEEELAHDYVDRIIGGLDVEDQGTALELGMAKMLTRSRVAEVSIPVKIWHTYLTGLWKHTPECPDNFREWARSLLTGELDHSSPYATNLTNVVEAVDFLMRQGSGWLPDDPEECFYRGKLRRWMAVAGKILSLQKDLLDAEARIRDAEEEEREGLLEEVGNIKDAIENLAEKAVDEAYTTQDLDKAGRQKSSLPPIVAREATRRDSMGRYVVAMSMSTAQKALFIQKTKGVVDYRLEGEAYGVEEWRYCEYRVPDPDPEDSSVYVLRRFMDSNEGWPKEWEVVTDFEGVFDQVSYVGETYTILKYWVKKGEDND